MKSFHFSPVYFNKLILDDPRSNIRIVINETPSLNIIQEEYSLRITTRHEEDRLIHRDYAIEKHMPSDEHYFPHLQFKFHTEGIGQFRIRIDLNDEEEYKKAILGFIYQIKILLNDMEKYKKGITNEILVLELVDKLEEHRYFLAQKIQEGIKKYWVYEDRKRELDINKVKENALLLDFIGKDNLKFIEEYPKK